MAKRDIEILIGARDEASQKLREIEAQLKKLGMGGEASRMSKAISQGFNEAAFSIFKLTSAVRVLGEGMKALSGYLSGTVSAGEAFTQWAERLPLIGELASGAASLGAFIGHRVGWRASAETNAELSSSYKTEVEMRNTVKKMLTEMQRQLDKEIIGQVGDEYSNKRIQIIQNKERADEAAKEVWRRMQSLAPEWVKSGADYDTYEKMKYYNQRVYELQLTAIDREREKKNAEEAQKQKKAVERRAPDKLEAFESRFLTRVPDHNELVPIMKEQTNLMKQQLKQVDEQMKREADFFNRSVGHKVVDIN